ncbi:MAG: DUF4157 domain-containing protein [Cyclobacteriaceae bacterium]
MEHLTIKDSGSKTIPQKQGDFFRKKNSAPFFIQPKLTINQPNDIYEQEADAMADKVMRMPDHEKMGQPFSRHSVSSLQRMCADCEEEDKMMQRKEGNGQETATDHELESYVDRLNGGGKTLPDEVRNFYEPRFGYDFSHVKLHTDGVAAKSAQSINALAYTSGSNIVFNHGQYDPGSVSGKKLLGHELTHVVQQVGGPVLQPKVDRQEANLPETEFQTQIGNASGNIPDEEPYMTSLSPIVKLQGMSPTPLLLKKTNSSVPVVQRTTNFAAGTVTATTNLASHLISGRRDAGFTPPTLNGTMILSAAAAVGAIKPPTIRGRSNMDGTETVWVDKVAANEASFKMEVPSGGPWSTVTPKVNADAMFTSIGFPAQAACATAGNTTFSVKGKPSDADLAANVTTHENLHASDHKAGFNNVIVPWDTKLEAAKSAKTEFSGANGAAAEASLFAAMGGTTNKIATDQHNKWMALNNATHAGKVTVATGGTVTPSNLRVNATCSTSSFDVT